MADMEGVHDILLLWCIVSRLRVSHVLLVSLDFFSILRLLIVL